MRSQLKDRYIYAVIRHLPQSEQERVKHELEQIFKDVLLEMGTANHPQEEDYRAVIEQLGPADELALNYIGQERKALISGAYFLLYKRVLWIVLPMIAIVHAVLAVVSHFLDIGFNPAVMMDVTIIGTTISMVVSTIFHIGGVLLSAFAIITIVFAIMEHTKTDISKEMFDLPDLPTEKETINPIGPIAWMVVSVVTTIVLLSFSDIIGWRVEGEWLPIFNSEVIRSFWLVIIVWTVAEVAIELFTLIEGRYTMRLFRRTLITSIVQIFCIITVFGNSDIVNPAFAQFVSDLPNTAERVLSNPNIAIMVICFIALAYDALETLYYALKAKSSI